MHMFSYYLLVSVSDRSLTLSSADRNIALSGVDSWPLFHPRISSLVGMFCKKSLYSMLVIYDHID